MVVALRPMTLGERIKKARQYARFEKQQDLCDRIKQIFGAENAPSQQAISRIEANKAKTSEFVVKIAVACEVSPWWMDSEMGPMLLDGKSLTVQIPSVNIRLLENIISLILERARKHSRKLTDSQLAQGAAQLYATTNPDGSLDMERVLTLISQNDGATERDSGNERKHQKSVKKDTGRSISGDRKKAKKA